MNPQRTSSSARRWRRVGFLATLSVLALVPAAAVAQPHFLDPPPLGTHLFQNFLNGFGLEPLVSVDDLAQKKPAETVLIVFGDLTCLDGMRGGLRKFVDEGGAVLIASDKSDGARLAGFQLQITGTPAIAPDKVIDVDNKTQPLVWLIPPGGDGIAGEGLVSVDRKAWKQKSPDFKGFTYDDVKKLIFTKSKQRLKPKDWEDSIVLSASRWQKQQAMPYKGLDEEFNDCMVLKSHIGVPHPIFADCVWGIVTDRPSFIHAVRLEKSSIELLCSFPPFWSTRSGFNQFGPKEPYIVKEPGFVAASSSAAQSKERVVILPGHSLFLNCALAQRDLDNATFATNTLQWLKDGNRKYCLFVKDSQAVTRFNVPLIQPPMPTARKLNDLLRGLETENFFNRELLKLIPKQQILRVLLTLTLIGLAIYGFRRYGAARHRQDYNVPLIETKLARLVIDFLPPLTRRRHQTLRGNDFKEAARVVARECFESGHAGLPPQPPVPVGGDHAALTHAVGLLWPLAHGENVRPVPADAFSRVVELARQVKAALALGTLRWKT
jgi:hypothetical protein